MNLQQRNRIKYDISQKLIEKYKNKSYQHVYNFLETFEQVKYQSKLSFMSLPIDIPVEKMHSEILAVHPFLVDHRDQYQEHQGWKSFCIHGKSYDATREDDYYNDQRPYEFTKEARSHMPATVDFFDRVFPYQSYQRVRVMLLEPGGYITVHNDYQTPRLSAVNIAITQPESCHFVMNKVGEVPFKKGSCVWVDISNYHTVFNFSKEPRYHIIVHGTPSKDFKNLVVEQYKKLYNRQL